MQAMEFSKKAGLFSKTYALGLTVALDAQTALPGEFRHIKETVLAWVSRRGDKCTAIRLTIVLTPEEIPDCKAFIDQVFTEEVELSPILQRIPFGVYFIDASEQLLEEYVPEPPG